MRTLRLLLIIGVISGSALGATVLIPAEFRQIVHGSELIAHGRVLDIQSEWADGRTRIESVVTVEVVTWLKGGTGQRLWFRVPGGELGRYRSVTVGAPVFRPGDEAVLFLKRTNGSPLPVVFGLSQGVFRVTPGPGSGQRMVVPPALMAPGETPTTVRRGAAERRTVSLDIFGAQVRAVMAEGPRGVQ